MDTGQGPAPDQTPSGRQDERRPVVVVGIDGSEGSSKALAWAAQEARMRGATLRVVHAWRNRRLSSTSYLQARTPSEASGLSAWAEEAYEEYRSQATSLSEDEPSEAEDSVASQIGAVLGASPDVSLERHVIQGRAAQAILEAAEDADLVVVGSRGHGGFAGLLLGSVSSQVAHHAHCPVTIVRA
jgi:nucleotide-binding universal stress UspA family protein